MMTSLHDIFSERKSAGEPGGAIVQRQSQPGTPISSSEVALNGSGPSSLAQESLSSASSFQSLSSKSSSGICADSVPGSPDKSYDNVDIPDLNDLINACAGINLGSVNVKVNGEEDSAEGSDHSQDQTFTSAADDTISEETRTQQLEDTLQTFKTCPVLTVKQLIAPQTFGKTPDSSVLPYVSFEESVLRKHQEKSEEFKSALASFQLSVTDNQDEQPAVTSSQRAVVNPAPCVEINVRNKLVDELKYREVASLDSSDVSFKEVSSFDSTVLIDSSDAEESTSFAPITLNQLNSKQLVESDNIEQKKEFLNITQNIVNQEQDLNKISVIIKENNVSNGNQNIVPENDLNVTTNLVEQENNLNEIQETVPESNLNETPNLVEQENILNKSQDIVLKETHRLVEQKNVLNKTQDIVSEIVFNKTYNLVEQENIFDETQDIVPENVCNITHSLVEQENVLNKTQSNVSESILNKTHNLVEQKNVLNETQDIVSEIVLNETHNLGEQEKVLNETQDFVLENVFNKTHNLVEQENILCKTQDIVTETFSENILNKTHDIVTENVFNKTHNLEEQENFLNKAHDFIKYENALNKTQEIISENILNKTQDLIKQENVLNKTQDLILGNVLNKTQDIVREKALNETVEIIEQKDILNNQDTVKQKDILNKTQEIVLENVFDKTNDIVNQNILNKTQDIVQESVLNKTQDIIKQDNIFNKSQNIKENSFNNNPLDVQETQVLDSNQSIKQEINGNYTQDKKKLENSALSTGGDDLNDTIVILQKAKQHLNEVDALSEKRENTIQHNTEIQKLSPDPILEANKELKEQKNKIVIQEAISPLTRDLSIQNKIKSPDKTEVIVLNSASEEFKSTVLNNSDLVASTPFDKSSNKELTDKKPSNRRSALFLQDTNKFDDTESAVAVEHNRTELESTIIINNLEETKDLQDDSFQFLPPREPEYEAFKPQQQSTTLPVDEDFESVLAEAALSVAKDIETSIENIEEGEKFVSATELFGDPAAFDFLNQVGSQNTKRGERYDSLFMKFDPLAQRLSMLPQKNLPTAHLVEEEVEIVKETKPTSPEEAANTTPTISDMNTPKKNPALAAIDRLLFYSPSVAGSDEVEESKQKKEVEKQASTPLVPVIDEKMAKELELVRSTVLQLENELEKQKKKHKETLEKQKAAYEEKINNLQTKFTHMQSQLTQEVKCKDQMTVVVEEYEKSISRLIAEREKDRTNFETEKAKLQEELQVTNQHLSNTEAAFSDVHSKYERLKNVVAAYKTNENVLKDSIADNQETIKSLENRYEQLKSHAMAQLEKANLELNAIRKHNEAENVKLKALVRKAELKSKSLEETVEQKMKENKELTKIIDEMIARVD